MKSGIKSKSIATFVIGYLDAIWFLAYGLLDRHDTMSPEWLYASVTALTITHVVMFIVSIVRLGWDVEKESKGGVVPFSERRVSNDD